METINSEGRLEESLIHFETSNLDKNLRKYFRRASYTISRIVWVLQTQKVVYKSAPFNLWHCMGTTNSKGSLEERFIQFVALYELNKFRT